MSNKQKIRTISIIFVSVSILGLASVSLLSLFDPQATMDLVSVRLGNNDALSSIRGIYGGVGIVIITSLCYLLATNINLAVRFLTLFWGAYAASRLITILVDGPLGAFGNQWIVIESVFFLVGLVIIGVNRNTVYAKA